MKIVTAADATPAGETLVIDGQYGLHQLFIINLESSKATCTADVADVSGAALATGLGASIRAGSLRHFRQVSNLVGAEIDPRARVDVTCDGLVCA